MGTCMLVQSMNIVTFQATMVCALKVQASLD